VFLSSLSIDVSTAASSLLFLFPQTCALSLLLTVEYAFLELSVRKKKAQPVGGQRIVQRWEDNETINSMIPNV
jgi:hypothetical protein